MAGIIGLACAIELQAELARRPDLCGTDVMIVAREWPACAAGGASTHSVDYASAWAGAHVRPVPATTPQLQREARWLRRAVAELGRHADAEPWCGVTRTTGVELIDEPQLGYSFPDAAAFERESGLRGYRLLPASALPDGVALGFEYETFCINPPMYCEYFLWKFLLQGGKTMRWDLSEWEACTLLQQVVIVVNASGTGFGDHECFPTRGLRPLIQSQSSYYTHWRCPPQYQVRPS